MTAQSAPTAPREVTCLVAIADIRAVRDAEQEVEVDFVLRISWRDPALAHEGPGRVQRPMADVWHPRGQVVNGAKLRELRPRVVEVAPDGAVVYRQRYVGQLTQRFAFEDFPLDSQVLRLDFVSSYGADEVRIVVDPRSGLFGRVSIPDWEIGSAEVEVAPLVLLGETFPAFSMKLSAERRVVFFIWKILLPLVLIVLMSWSVFWIRPALAASKISVAVTSVLTLIAYRFALGQILPNLPYLTRMDYFITGSSVLVFLALVEVIASCSLVDGEDGGRALRLDRLSRVVFPTLFVGLTSLAFWI